MDPRDISGVPRASATRPAEAGFSLMEAIVATAIAVIAVLGLAHTFALGRAFVDRFEIARMAMSAVNSRMETLSVLPSMSPEFSIGAHPETPIPFSFHEVPIGTENWRVEWYDDPATPLTTMDLKLVTVVVSWGRGADQDSVRLTRIFQP
jgi:hypothetical protein